MHSFVGLIELLGEAYDFGVFLGESAVFLVQSLFDLGDSVFLRQNNLLVFVSLCLADHHFFLQLGYDVIALVDLCDRRAHFVV